MYLSIQASEAIEFSLLTVSFTLPPKTLAVYLPPTNEVCEGYVFTGVCLSTGGGGVYATHTPTAECMLGYGQQAGSTHPTGMHSCLYGVFPLAKSDKIVS